MTPIKFSSSLDLSSKILCLPKELPQANLAAQSFAECSSDLQASESRVHDLVLFAIACLSDEIQLEFAWEIVR